jgi:hypothetical protein
MGSRKTVDLLMLVEFANLQLAEPKNSPEYKHGVATMIEKALMKAGRYEGFMYLDNQKDHAINGPYEFDRKYFFHHLLNEKRKKKTK